MGITFNWELNILGRWIGLIWFFDRFFFGFYFSKVFRVGYVGRVGLRCVGVLNLVVRFGWFLCGRSREGGG